MNIDVTVKPLPITAVVVSFQPDLSQIEVLLVQLTDQVENVVVVDNASENSKYLSALCQKIACHFIPFQQNYGLGRAHNAGIDYAKSKGSEFVLILDQDSQPDANMVPVLYEKAKHLIDKKTSFSAIGPVYSDEQKNFQSGFVKFGFMRFIHQQKSENVVESDFLISSGSLFSLSALNKVGPMREDLFIDHVDTEWFLRAKGLGLNCYGCYDAKMIHQLGEKTKNIWLGRWRSIPFHKSFRYYYIYRNSVLLYKDKNITFKWKSADIMRLMKMFVVFCVFSKNRKDNLFMTFKGVNDGCLGKSGKLKE